MGSPSVPKVPDPAKAYAQGIQTNIQYAPELASEEYQLRGQYDDPSVAQSLARQQQFAPQALSMYKGMLNQVDPTGQALRTQLGNAVSSDLSAGTSLGAPLTRDYDQAIRAAEAARGNTTGNSAVSAEALNQGMAGQALYQQRLQNAGSFLQQDNTVQQLTGVAGLATAASQPDRSFNYVNPLSGQQGQNVALQYYQSALAGGSLAAQNPWLSAAAGAGGQFAGGLASGLGKQAASGIGSYLSSLGSSGG